MAYIPSSLVPTKTRSGMQTSTTHQHKKCHFGLHSLSSISCLQLVSSLLILFFFPFLFFCHLQKSCCVMSYANIMLRNSFTSFTSLSLFLSLSLSPSLPFSLSLYSPNFFLLTFLHTLAMDNLIKGVHNKYHQPQHMTILIKESNSTLNRLKPR